MNEQAQAVDEESGKLLEFLAGTGTRPPFNSTMHEAVRHEIYAFYTRANDDGATRPEDPGQATRIARFFEKLVEIKNEKGFFADQLGFDKKELTRLALRHRQLDEHGVSVAGRVFSSPEHIKKVFRIVEHYFKNKKSLAPSGLDRWDAILENFARIQKMLRMDEKDWNSPVGQIKNAIDSLITLSQVVKLPEAALVDLMKVTQRFGLRIPPYFAGLVFSGTENDPILLQCLPTGESLEPKGESSPPLCATRSPARLVDRIYPFTVAIKATVICPVHCAHCVRREHIPAKDFSFPLQAYNEALEYIRKNKEIRDVLITGGDPLMLSDKVLHYLLTELDKIGHVEIKRIGTRVPTVLPQRISDQLLAVLGRSNEQKPLRLMTHINSAMEITPISLEALKKLSRVTSAILNQTVLLRGVNDSSPAMWRLCEILQQAYVKPHYLFSMSTRHPDQAYLAVPIAKGRDIVEGMIGVLPGDAIPRYMALAHGKVPLERCLATRTEDDQILLTKPWSGLDEKYPDVSQADYAKKDFGFARYK
ncbi:MAG: KamA family radical SAM protein [Desulfatibacillaceae bacterium]|nr:KamA family radical SAM protein [Desulfatibacillaceae bacterium]